MAKHDDTVTDERSGMLATINAAMAASSARDVDGVLELCTDDVEMRSMFQPPGFPNHATGKGAMRSMLSATSRYSKYAENVVSIEAMLDPDNWVVELEGDMVVQATGRPYRNNYLLRLHFREGKIATWVIYHNPLTQLIAFDMINPDDLPAPPPL
ncbi:nuclear transport factor 2 family protein [Nocardia sp. CA-128927]|uniref:nuclear transport factor 2 family protein n=1 Tax=Nocardia sp. CA-128927 TaxID=3239975 RepID=UPI003D986EBB